MAFRPIVSSRSTSPRDIFRSSRRGSTLPVTYMTHRNPALFCSQAYRGRVLVWTLLVTGMGAAFIPSAHAQIVPDQTLGAESSIVISEPLQGVDRQKIEGGAIRADVLFHSFEAFNVDAGSATYFASPAGIANILSRVTGNEGSDIMGQLGVLGNANLFLLNPNGIVFGPESSLDIRGSFVASTADRFTFANGMTFSAIAPNAAPLLTLNLTPGLQYGNSPRGAIATQGTLSVGETLTLSGANLNLQGRLSAGHDLRLHGLNTVTIRDTEATPFLATAENELTIQGNQAVDIFALNHPMSGLWAGGNLTLRSNDSILGDAHYGSGGDFRIERLDGSLMSWSSPADPVIRATGDVSFESYEGDSLHILAGGSVTVPGAIVITGTDEANGITETVTLSNGDTLTIEGGSVPTLDIRAGVDVTQTQVPAGSGDAPGVVGASAFTDLLTDSTSPLRADITVGEIQNQSGDDENIGTVFLSNQYRANDDLLGDISIGSIDVSGDLVVDSRGEITTTAVPIEMNSDGGDITLLASDRIQFDLVEINSEGGDITLDSGDRLIFTRGEVNSGLFQEIGDDTEFNDFNRDIPGDISLAATDTIRLQNMVITADGGGITGTGDTGDISIQSRQGSIIVRGGNAVSEITSSALSQGFAGDLTLIANDRLVIRNSELLSNFDLDFDNDNVEDFEGEGGAGQIQLTGGNAVRLIRSQVRANSISTDTTEDTTGSITITANQGNIRLRNSRLDTNTLSSGFAGDINLNALAGAIQVIGNTDAGNEGIFADAQVGSAGDITLTAADLAIRQGGRIAARTSTGIAGNIFINSTGNPLESLVINGDGSRLSVRATGDQGDAGRVDINARTIDITNGGSITAANTSHDNTVEETSVILNHVEQISLINGGQISVRTQTGQAGSVEINSDREHREQPADAVILAGDLSGITARATMAGGDAGEIRINARAIIVEEGAQITATNVDGTVPNADTLVQFENVERLEVLDGGQISVLTDVGIASNVEINPNGAPVNSLVAIAGNGSTITAQATGSSTVASRTGAGTTATHSPTAGNVEINIQELLVADGGDISVSSPDGIAGNLIVNARFITLNNGQLQAIIGQPQAMLTDTGANIELNNVDNLLLQNNSLISASAIGSANGGTITIGADPIRTLVSAPSNANSDIIATAQQGAGGTITLNVAQVEGFTVQNFAAGLERNATNDISASSQGGPQGVINLETPSVNPLRSLTNLPGVLVNVPPVATLCRPQSPNNSAFIQVGRGGLPTHPRDSLGPGTTSVPWVLRPPVSPNDSAETSNIWQPTERAQGAMAAPHPRHSLVESQGWTLDAQGNFMLTAYPSSAVQAQGLVSLNEAQGICTP